MGHRTSSESRLTPRQRDVLRGIAAGRTNSEIATQLGIGFETVKMHVSDILAELGVQSREEAAAWWRDTTSLASRARRAVGLVIAAKVSVGAAVAGAAAVAAFVAIATIVATKPDGDTPAPAAALGIETATATAGDRATSVSISSLDADALHTEVAIEVEGIDQNSPSALYYLTDSAGQRQILQRTDAGTFEGYAVAAEPGELTFEVGPTREAADPPIGATDPLPVWTSSVVPWTGYTSATVELTLPSVARLPIAAGTASIERIQRSDTRVRIYWSVDGLGDSAELSAIQGRLFYPDGSPVLSVSGAGGGREPASAITQFPAVSGDVSLIVHVFDNWPCPSATPGTIPVGCQEAPPELDWTLDERRADAGNIAEFRITLP